MEKDSEISSGSYTTHFRALDTRIGRWLSVDPKANLQPDQSPYNSSNNTPIFGSDPNGDVCVPCLVWAFSIGFGLDVGYQATINYGNPKARINWFSGIVSGGTSMLGFGAVSYGKRFIQGSRGISALEATVDLGTDAIHQKLTTGEIKLEQSLTNVAFGRITRLTTAKSVEVNTKAVRKEISEISGELSKLNKNLDWVNIQKKTPSQKLLGGIENLKATKAIKEKKLYQMIDEEAAFIAPFTNGTVTKTAKAMLSGDEENPRRKESRTSDSKQVSDAFIQDVLKYKKETEKQQG